MSVINRHETWTNRKRLLVMLVYLDKGSSSASSSVFSLHRSVCQQSCAVYGKYILEWLQNFSRFHGMTHTSEHMEPCDLIVFHNFPQSYTVYALKCLLWDRIMFPFKQWDLEQKHKFGELTALSFLFTHTITASGSRYTVYLGHPKTLLSCPVMLELRTFAQCY